MGNKSPLFNFISVCANLYLVTVLIAAPYFNWQFAREHGFAEWLAWGEIMPTAKALVWPYFAIRGPKSPPPAGPLSPRQWNEMNIRSVNRAFDASQQANYIINSKGALTPDDVEKVRAYADQALHSARTTDEATLNNIYPELGTRFERDFGGGLRLLISGLRSRSRAQLTESSDLDRAWKDWYMANRKQIEDAFNAALQ